MTPLMLKSVSTWVALQQSLRAIEAVSRSWARELVLEPSDVLLLLLFSRTEQTPTTLAQLCGRSRQQVHRSLLRLESEGVVEVASFTRRGKIAAWRLSATGLTRLECIERRMAIWEQHLVGRVDVDVLLHELRGTLRALVNRMVDAYFSGLYRPEELRRDPNLEFAREAVALQESIVEARARRPAETRKELARKIAEREDYETLEACWRQLAS